MQHKLYLKLDYCDGTWLLPVRVISLPEDEWWDLKIHNKSQTNRMDSPILTYSTEYKYYDGDSTCNVWNSFVLSTNIMSTVLGTCTVPVRTGTCTVPVRLYPASTVRVLASIGTENLFYEYTTLYRYEVQIYIDRTFWIASSSHHASCTDIFIPVWYSIPGTVQVR